MSLCALCKEISVGPIVFAEIECWPEGQGLALRERSWIVKLRCIGAILIYDTVPVLKC